MMSSPGAIQSLALNFPVQEHERRILVLATAGEPGGCDYLNPQTPGNQMVVRQLTEDAVRDAYEDFGIEVWVFGIGATDADAHLQRIANAGSANRSTIPFLPFGIIPASQSGYSTHSRILPARERARIDGALDTRSRENA